MDLFVHVFMCLFVHVSMCSCLCVYVLNVFMCSCAHEHVFICLYVVMFMFRLDLYSIRWQVQRGLTVVPKSVNPDRQSANLDVRFPENSHYCFFCIVL